VQHLGSQHQQQHQNGYVTDPAGVQHLGSQHQQQHQDRSVARTPVTDPAGVQHLGNQFSQHLEEYSYSEPINVQSIQHQKWHTNPTPINDRSRVRNLAIHRSVSPGFHGSGAIAESFSPSNWAGHPAMRGSGAIAESMRGIGAIADRMRGKGAIAENMA
jgi:hypothetical protein